MASSSQSLASKYGTRGEITGCDCMRCCKRLGETYDAWLARNGHDNPEHDKLQRCPPQAAPRAPLSMVRAPPPRVTIGLAVQRVPSQPQPPPPPRARSLYQLDVVATAAAAAERADYNSRESDAWCPSKSKALRSEEKWANMTRAVAGQTHEQLVRVKAEVEATEEAAKKALCLTILNSCECCPLHCSNGPSSRS